MREAIVADIHGNLEGLEAVLKDIDKQHVDRLICLGDTIGYGANPRECLSSILKKAYKHLFGNHERFIRDLFISVKRAFSENPYLSSHNILFSMQWTKKKLEGRINKKRNRRRYMELFNKMPDRYEENNILYVHGSPRDPVSEYLSGGDVEDLLHYNDPKDTLGLEKIGRIIETPEEKLETNFSLFDWICFNGNNHIPGLLIRPNNPTRRLIIEGKKGKIKISNKYNYVYPRDLKGNRYYLRDDEKVVVNVGSSGQSRNCDPRASYFIHNTGKRMLECRRVRYDLEKAAKKIIRAGLPKYYATRLFKGI
ncbi:metallophosphoesterase [Candidatus Woesearchaeota archaeon]|nr:metallophosphoesterase [Candidatus Woesearchaeota archaeon]